MYLKHFKFRAQPFQLSPDPRFLYESSVHTRAIAHLKFGLNQGDGFIVITGDVGAGKTTIIQYLLSTLSHRKFVASTVVMTNLDDDNLIRMIAAGFGLKQEGRDKASILNEIESFLRNTHRQRKRVLLFVDEAQNLSVGALEELRMLSNIQVDGKPPLQLFLLGQPQFRKTLAREDLLQLRQRIIASYHLGPLNEQETQEYIIHRLSQVGWKNRPYFGAGAFERIYHYTKGVPRRINNLCSRLLLFCFLEEKDLIDPDAVKAVAEDLENEFEQILDHSDTPQTIDPLGDIDDLSAEKLKELIDIVEAAPAGDTAALSLKALAESPLVSPMGANALTKERSYNQLFKRLLLLILDEYMKGRPEPHRQ